MFFDKTVAKISDTEDIKVVIALLTQVVTEREAAQIASNAGQATERAQALYRLARVRLTQQQARQRFLPEGLLRDPGWNILLDLYVHECRHKPVCITSACTASGVPPTTALRWVQQLQEAELVTRVLDEGDRRRKFIALTEKARSAIECWLLESA